MNHIHRSIWNDALGTWVAVSEIAQGSGKHSSNRRKLFVTSVIFCTASAWALPTGEQVMAGQASVSLSNNHHMEIQQSSQKAVINWQGFSLAPNDAVHIHQPNSQAALLNRVVGQDASQIQGQLRANGQVYVVNPNGVVFGKSAQVDVGGLVASTHNISNADFMAGKNHFTQDNATGSVENHGTINTPKGGVVALIGDSVSNTGTINTPKGTTALAAGKTVDLDFKGDGLVEVKVSEEALNAQINNKGAIKADGGRVVLTSKAANQLIDTVINQDGIVQAHGLAERNGEIILEGGYVVQTGTLDASGKEGGKVSINARTILDAGKTNVDGTENRGGKISMAASDSMIQTAAAVNQANGKTTGGSINLETGNNVFSSGKLSATGAKGGTINVVSSGNVTLAAADVDASGTDKGGLIRIGGDFHGAKTKLSSSAQTTTVNGWSHLKADGDGGKVVVWSEQKTDYFGSISANKKGEVEVSSKGSLNYGGSVNAGVGGTLLLDPKNIIISSKGGAASFALEDPHAAAGNKFGFHTTLLGTTVGGLFDSKLGKIVGGDFTPNGNVAISSPFDDFAGNNAGAVYLFNTNTGSLLATLTGSHANDNVGLNGITALTNGNYVVSSVNWDNGINSDVGAATWGNGTTGVSGIVSSANSLVGSTNSDNVGQKVTALSNGNYVVGSPNWDNGVDVDAGAATWGNGTIGTSGVVSLANSLVGSSSQDRVSSSGITALNNGNYVVGSPNWDNGVDVDVGAATWGNGNGGTSGTINASISLIGSQRNDSVGASVTALTNRDTALTKGNYVVGSSNWSDNRGAVTWGNGDGSTVGTVSSTNSLVGSISGDRVGSTGITALSNGNYVVASSFWSSSSSVSLTGAVTWGDGSGVTNTNGIVSTSNSLTGAKANDNVGGGGITTLSQGNYVISSPNWDNGSVVNAGAVTWGDGSGVTNTNGIVSTSNSLTGAKANDNVGGGGVTALSQGNNYVISSPNWGNGSVVNAGAVTWRDGSGVTIGIVSTSNSLTGAKANDNVGGGGVTALSQGNYVISSPNWGNGSVVNAGAVTWVDVSGVTNGVTNGIVSTSNSLTGAKANDNVGGGGVTALNNGNYVISSPKWDNGIIVDAGAATWGNGNTRITGVISSTNSLVGTKENDSVSGVPSDVVDIDTDQPITNRITALPDGNYVVNSIGWNNGAIVNSGASTWGNGSTGSSGAVSSANSLTGSALFDWIAVHVAGLANGSYILSSSTWDNAGLVDAGVDAGQVRIGTPRNIFFANGLGQTMIVNPLNLVNTLALGTNIVLQASNDITLDVNSDIIVDSRNGGDLSFQAGRNITLNSNIVTGDGDFTSVAGDPGAIPGYRDPGTPIINLGTGATINAGTGKVILAAIGGNFANNTGLTTPITASQWLVYSTDPRLNSRNGMLADSKHYGQFYNGITPNYASIGDWFLYSITPTLTVTPAQTVSTGALPASFNFSLTGFLDGDSISTAGISGTPLFDVKDFTGKPGFYDVSYLNGLFSSLGYEFADDKLSFDELIVQAQSPIIDNNKPTPNETNNTILRELVESGILVSQTSTLEQSVVAPPLSPPELFEDEDMLDIKNEGIKLPLKFHRIISLSICPTGSRGVL